MLPGRLSRARNLYRYPNRPLSSCRYPNHSHFHSSGKQTFANDSANAVEIARQQASSSQVRSHVETPHIHAVISTFDLFSIGVGPSSSHTVGPWRAAGIFLCDLKRSNLLETVHSLKITLYGSLAATGRGHATAEALMMGFEGFDVETVDTSIIIPKFKSILDTKSLTLGQTHRIQFDMERDVRWRWDAVLPEHSNGMTFTVHDKNGDMIATQNLFSIGGGFVVTNDVVYKGENAYYKETDKDQADPARRDQSHGNNSLTMLPAPITSGEEEAQVDSKWTKPPMPFHSAASLLELTKKYNMTIAQIVWENEKHYLTDAEIKSKIMKLWEVMDACIRSGVTSTETYLPNHLKLRRRAPALYKRLMKGFYPSLYSDISPSLDTAAKEAKEHMLMGDKPISSLDLERKSTGLWEHPLKPVPTRKSPISPALDFLSCYAIAVNEVNASGGRIVTSPTNGASGCIPGTLKYFLEFLSDEPERDIMTFLLTAAAIGMLFKRGATISAAEGGCMAEVGVACSMAAAGFTACMGGNVEQILQAAEIGIEHNLGLSCDPIGGLVAVPCIERNALGAVKAVTASCLALAGDGEHLVSLDEAIHAVKQTAVDMSTKYKETSLGGLATTVSVKVPMC